MVAGPVGLRLRNYSEIIPRGPGPTSGLSTSFRAGFWANVRMFMIVAWLLGYRRLAESTGQGLEGPQLD